MSGYYIPSNDQAYNSWLENFVTVLNGYLVQLHLVAADVEPLDTGQATFATALTDYMNKKVQIESASATKKETRRDTEALLRALVNRITGDPNMTDGMRAALGLPIPQPGHGSLPVGEEIPDLFLESSPGRVIVHFGTEPNNERINGKPSWAKGANIYRQKAGESDFQLVAFSTSSPYRDPITGPASDYTYVVRYRGTKTDALGGASSPMSIAASGQLAA